MSRPSRRGRLVAAAAAALVATGLLSGCGVSDQRIRPGVAAQVGDREITIDELDESLDDACAYFASQAQKARLQDPTVGVTAQPRGDLRAQLLVLLIQRAVAEQVLDDAGADVGDDYEASVNGLSAQRPEATEEQLAAVLQGDEAFVYAQSAVTGAGAALLAEEGVEEPTQDEVQARGERAFTEWVAAHEIDVNPLFGVTVEDGTISSGSIDDTSVAVSTFSVEGRAAADAVAGDAAAADPNAAKDAIATYVASLPADQTCG